MKGDAYASAIESHYRRPWRGPFRRERHSVGPVHELPPDFEVLVFQREGARAYATKCMSQPTDKERLELHLLTEVSSPFRPELVELMTAIAHFHRTGQSLGMGHSVNFGRPWLDRGTCSFGLISLPYLDGPKLEWMLEPRVRFLWLVPITEREREFKIAHGTEALEQRLEAAGFNYLDPSRESVV